MESKLTKLEVQEIVKKKYVRDDFINRNFGYTTYKEFNEIVHSKYKSREQTKNLRIYVSRMPYIILITIATFFLLTFPYLNRTNYFTSEPLKNIYIIIFLLIVFSFCKILSNKKLFIQVLQNSFIIEKREIFWNEIITTGKLIVSGDSSQEFLILGLDTGEILKVDFDKLSEEQLDKVVDNLLTKMDK